ncbi:MAG: TonB-dependent receptor [Ferruginibacter sp.]
MKNKSLIIIVSLLFSQNIYSQNLDDNFSDTSKIVRLQDILVWNTKKQTKVIDYFKSNQVATLEEIMGKLPEISMIKRGPYGMEPTIRSLSGGQINVLIDGMRIHGACTDKMDPATIYIEPANLQSLEIQTGSSGFINGSSIGGTINLRMAEPEQNEKNKLSGMFLSGYQTAAKSFYESVHLNYSTGKFSFKGSSTYRKSDDYRSGEGKTISFSQFEKVNYSLSAKYKLNERIYYKLDFIGDDGWNIGYPALPMDVGYAGARIGALSINYSDRSKKFYSWQSKIYGNKVKHDMDDTHRPFVPMHMDMPGISETLGFFSEGSYRINQHQNLDLRIDGSSTFLKASMTMYEPGELPMYMLTWPDNRTNQLGLGATWKLHVNDKLSFWVSGRTDVYESKLVTEESKAQASIFGYDQKNRKEILKNISIKSLHKINKNISASASISYSERMPTASEMYGFYLFNSNEGYDYIGNPTLQVEKSLQSELSATIKWNRSRVQITGYYLRVGNYISGMVDPSLSVMTIGAKGVKSYVSEKYVNLFGGEAVVFISTHLNIDIVSTFKYIYGEDLNSNHLPSISPFRNITSVRKKFNKAFVQIESEASATQNRYSINAGESKTDGFVLFNVRSGYNFKISKYKTVLQGGIENLLDKNYTEHLDWGKIPRPGRNFYMQLKFIF